MAGRRSGSPQGRIAARNFACARRVRLPRGSPASVATRSSRCKWWCPSLKTSECERSCAIWRSWSLRTRAARFFRAPHYRWEHGAMTDEQREWFSSLWKEFVEHQDRDPNSLEWSNEVWLELEESRDGPISSETRETKERL